MKTAPSKFGKVEQVNRVYGIRAALREADFLCVDVRYQDRTGNLECWENGILVQTFKAN